MDNYNKELKKFVVIHKGPLDTIFSLFKPFSGDKILCPIYTTYEKFKFNNEFGQPLCTITDSDIKKGNITLVSSLINIYKKTLIFCNICNSKGESYYTQEEYLKTGEEAIYSQVIIKDLILPKFLAFIFEDNNGCYIPGK